MSASTKEAVSHMQEIHFLLCVVPQLMLSGRSIMITLENTLSMKVRLHGPIVPSKCCECECILADVFES